MSAFDFSIRFENLDKLIRSTKSDLTNLSLHLSTCNNDKMVKVIFLLFDWNKYFTQKKISISAQIQFQNSEF